MSDDRFDLELSDRLRAYESRLPDAAAPVPGASRPARTLRWPIIGVGALAVTAVILLAAVLLRPPTDDNVGEASASPAPSTSAHSSAAPSGSVEPIESTGPTPTPQPTPSSPPPTADLAWTEVASFGSPDTPMMVNDVVRSDGGLVAVGVAYEGVLPNLGPPPPHDGRVWLSTSVSTWEDVTPEGIFADATLRHLVITSDRRIIAHGSVETDEFGVPRFAAWESIAGRRWEEIETGFPDQAWPMVMAQGARGHVAVVVEPDAPTLAAWYSADGRAWERVRDLGPEGSYAVGAGDEGFVIAGSEGSAQVPITLASGDGRSWFEAETPPAVAAGVAARGGDWWMLTRESEMPLSGPSSAGAWTSRNGLEWASAGAMPLDAADDCTEWPISLYSAGPWLVAGTLRQYPCSEGGFRTYGAQRISLDGFEWSVLPFGPAASEGNLGTRIGGALEVEGRLVLVGEQDRVATFWIGEQP